MDFITAIARAGSESQYGFSVMSGNEVHQYVTHLIFLEGSPVVNKGELEALGVRCYKVAAKKAAESGKKILQYDEDELACVIEIIFDS